MALVNPIVGLNTSFRRESDLGNIAVGKKSTGKISMKNNIHAIYFYATVAGTGATRTQIDTDVNNIIIRYQGKQIFELTALQILDLFKHKNDSKGALTVAGIIPVIFVRKDLPLAGQNNNYALGMLDKSGGKEEVAVLNYELNWKSPGSLTIDAVQCFVEFDELPYREIGAHIRTMTYTRSFGDTGQQDITDLPTKGIAGILAYHIVSGDVSKFSVKYNNTDVYRDLSADLNVLLQRNAKLTAQSGYTHICFNLQNDLASVQSMVGVDNWLIQPYWSSSPGGSYSILAEQLHVGM